MPQKTRFLTAFLVVLFPALLGWMLRSPYLIFLLAILYTPLYFMGKAGAWTALGRMPLPAMVLKAILPTYVTQIVVVGLFYLVGAGLATLFTDRSVTWALGPGDAAWCAGFAAIVFPLTLLIGYRETRAMQRDGDAGSAPDLADDDDAIEAVDGDFIPLPRPVTPETFYSGEHYSRRNYTGTALKDITDYNGEKPVRTPKVASEAMIAATEERLGLRLPDTLRRLYKIQDGGSLPTYYVPKYPGAAPTHDNWTTAFADDYNDLLPLKDLQSLRDHHLEYEDEEDAEDWIPGCGQLIPIALRTGYGTALDYRTGETPGVLLFDNGLAEREIQRFDDFDAFLAACREITSDWDRNRREDEIFGEAPDLGIPHRFWAEGNADAPPTSAEWAAAGARLGVTLPEALHALYRAANGGKSHYKVALAESGDPTDPPVRPFPKGPYVSEGLFLKLDHWISLATLSDRLDFIDGYTPWRDLYEQPDKLIVISAAFDSALMLDYRAEPDAPAVLAVADLDKPETAYRFASVEDFLSRLRQFGNPKHPARTAIGDPRIMARKSDATTFWIADPAIDPVDPAVLEATTRLCDAEMHGLPKWVKDVYGVQNGGKARFRYAPPQSENAHGYTVSDPSASNWIDVFPDGLLPMEDWQPFEAWRAAQGVALEQPLADLAEGITTYSDEDASFRLLVIGDHAATPMRRRMVTLLDMSSRFSSQNRHILTAAHDPGQDRFEIVFGPVLCDNIYRGLYQTLRARDDEGDTLESSQ